MDEQFIRTIVEQVLGQLQPTEVKKREPGKIPIAVSARHVHLSEEHVRILFGESYTLGQHAPLSQPGQFAANEQVTIVGKNGAISNVRILGPARSLTQVEISMTDARTLGIEAPLRYSGDLQGSAPITLVGPKGSVYLTEGCIIAAAHIHMNEHEAAALQVTDGQLVNVRTCTARPLVFQQVKVRISSRFQLEMHIDTDEGNAALIQGHSYGEIVSSLKELPTSAPVKQPIQFRPAPEKKTAVITKKLITEQDMKEIRQQELVIQKRTILTALAQDMARKKGIKIVRQ